MSTILITGSNKGIGFELTKVFLENNWHTIACCRNPEKAHELNKIAKDSKNIEIQELDVSNFAQIDNLSKKLENEKIDILLNNAGIYGDPTGQYFGELNYESWSEAFLVNAMAPIKMAESFYPHVSNSEKKMIATVTSMMGSITLNTDGQEVIYRSSKNAANMAYICLANKLRNDKITVLVLHPGWVKTDMGGEKAPILPEESAKGLLKVMLDADINDSGTFFSYTGDILPW